MAEIVAVNPVGAPPKYKPEYCIMLLEHMADGNAIFSFAFKIGVCEQTLYNWFKDHPEFLESKNVGTCGSFAWWEKEAKKGLWSDTITEGQGETKITTVSKINATVLIYNMKCRFKKFGYNISAVDQAEEPREITITINRPK